MRLKQKPADDPYRCRHFSNDKCKLDKKTCSLIIFGDYCADHEVEDVSKTDT